MRILVTGSAGHLGEALVLTPRSASRNVVGLDVRASRLTDAVGSIVDRARPRCTSRTWRPTRGRPSSTRT